jgi:ADP-ribose pyrophosphatase YjhB (NUDIX family)
METNTFNFPEHAPKMMICVGTVVLQEDKVLFVRQAYGKLKGKWSLPWGFVDGPQPGSLEAPDTTALRETLEEAGVTAEMEGLLGLQNHCTQRGEPVLYLLFLCRHRNGEPTPDNHETDRAAYFSLQDIQEFDEPFDPFCKWIALRVLQGEHYVTPGTTQNPYHPYRAFL